MSRRFFIAIMTVTLLSHLHHDHHKKISGVISDPLFLPLSIELYSILPMISFSKSFFSFALTLSSFSMSIIECSFTMKWHNSCPNPPSVQDVCKCVQDDFSYLAQFNYLHRNVLFRFVQVCKINLLYYIYFLSLYMIYHHIFIYHI